MSNSSAISAAYLVFWEKKAYERHRTRVETATSTVDIDPPRARPHVIRDAKRLQLQRERQAEIMRNNFILLRNLTDIMHGRKKNYRLDEKRSKCIKTL